MFGFYIVDDNYLLMSSVLLKTNEQYIDAGLANLLTPFGFIVPVDAGSTRILDYLEHADPGICGMDDFIRAGVINHDRMYNYTINSMRDHKTSKSRYIVERENVLTGAGSWYVRTSRGPYDGLISSIHEIMRERYNDPVERLHQTLAHVKKAKPIRTDGYEVISIDSIKETIKAKYGEIAHVNLIELDARMAKAAQLNSQSGSPTTPSISDEQ